MEIRKTIPLIITLNKFKYLAITLTQDTNVLCNANYRVLKKEIKKIIRKLKKNPFFIIGRINIGKVDTLPKN